MLGAGCSASGPAGEFGLVVILGVVGLGALVLVIEKAKRAGSGIGKAKPNNERGRNLDKMLEERKGKRLAVGQRDTIREYVGLSHWLPEKWIAPWEERILVFLDSIPITYMKENSASYEMRLLVAAEASLLIVNRPMSDYRHLKSVHLWEDEIPGMENARGTATRHEVNLSWSYLKKTIRNARDGHNLCLHEFAHVIDFADDGIAQSIPVGRDSADYDEWRNMVEEEHRRLMKAYESGKNYSIRAYGGFKSIKGDKPELFSCASSAFFERGVRLKRECPRVYEALRKFYGIDPSTWRKQKET